MNRDRKGHLIAVSSLDGDMTDEDALGIELFVDTLSVSQGPKGLRDFDGVFAWDVVSPFQERLERDFPSAEVAEMRMDTLLRSYLHVAPAIPDTDIKALQPIADGRFAAMRVRRVPASMLRGITSALYPDTFLVDHVHVARDFTFNRAPQHSVAWKNGRWNLTTNGTKGWNAIGKLDLERGVGMVFYVHEAVAGHWVVKLGYDDSPRLAFPTSPVGVREAFRLRDKPSGRSRREALLHWVRAHSRRRASDSDNAEALIEVRQHLRGASEFHWNGLHCTIKPAAESVQ